MSMPFYVPPEQMMKDRADYARKGIARGRSLVAFSATDGIVIVAENAYRTLHKVGEIYDRIAFAGVGKYNEFQMLRVAGIRQADLKGYSFAREDVNARSLADAYGQQGDRGDGKQSRLHQRPNRIGEIVPDSHSDPAFRSSACEISSGRGEPAAHDAAHLSPVPQPALRHRRQRLLEISRYRFEVVGRQNPAQEGGGESRR